MKKERILKERLNKVKQRRLLKHGYSLDEIKEKFQHDKEIEEIDQEIYEFEQYAKNPDLSEATKTVDETSQQDEFPFLKTMKRKINLDRDWDKPKLSK